jgi:hypothetical protein
MSCIASTLCKLKAALAIGLTSMVGFACGGGGGTSNPDGAPPDDGGGPDGSVDPAGLTVEFVYLDAAGDPVSGQGPIVFPNFSIRQMTMQLHRVEVIGDVALGGDLVHPSLMLEYPWQTPPRFSFPTARPGIYTHIDYRVERPYETDTPPPGTEDLSIRVVGEAMVDGVPREFEYVDEDNVKIQLKFWKQIYTNQPGTLVVALDLAGWFDVVVWDSLDDGEDPDGGDDGNGDGGPGDGGPGDGGAGDGGDEDGEGDEVMIDARTAREMRNRLKTAFQIRE